jgi:hypothetical protein
LRFDFIVVQPAGSTVFDKSARIDGACSREDFTPDNAGDVYRCPTYSALTTTGILVNDEPTIIYRVSNHDCQGCLLSRGVI